MSASSNNGSSSQTTALDNIKNVIVLMFENRSFDHILGAMPGADGVHDNNKNVLPELYNTMNPTTAPGDDNTPTFPTVIVPDSSPQMLIGESQVVKHDFTHDFGDGMLQDIFGPGTTGVISGKPQNNPSVTYPATNSGFLSTIAYDVKGQPPNGKGALSYFDWGSMEVLHKLAESFLVCDAWHCDMPGHTSPNRAFMHCATTGDLGINDDDSVGSTRMVNRTTIFERIQETNQTWKMYSQNLHLDTNWLNEQVLSQQYNQDDPTAFNVTNVPLANFFTDLENGTLPFYSFIMCWSDFGPDTSMHPASPVEAGENMLACIYNALQSSNYWTDTLLIVNFDENGGMYDHRGVPQATPPDFAPSDSQQPPISTWFSKYTKQTYSFDFSILGVRIPVLLISPWLNAGVCNTQYQNTSILRFLQDLLPNPDSIPYYLTQRDLNAPTIAPVFDYAQFGSQNERTDYPVNLQGYGNSVTCSELQIGNEPSVAELATPPAPHMEKMTRVYFGPMPGHPDSGKPLTRGFATVGEMRAYAQERLSAALAYLKNKEL